MKNIISRRKKELIHNRNWSRMTFFKSGEEKRRFEKLGAYILLLITRVKEYILIIRVPLELSVNDNNNDSIE